MSDPIDKAIAAAAAPKPVDMIGINVTLSNTGRPVRLAVPADMTLDELRELTGWMNTSMWAQLQAQGKPKIMVPQLVVPRN